MNKTYLEINLDILRNNVETIIKKYDNYKYYFGVVKSNAYGHGEYIVNELIKGGINYIAVSYLEEALKVREFNKDIPIICFVPIDLEDIEIAINNKITFTIANIDYLKELIKILKNNIKVHIKLDTGMNRLGIKDKDEFNEIYNLIKDNKYIELEGIYTHLSTIGFHDKIYDNEINTFKYLTKDIDLNSVPIIHLTSSANLVAHEKIDFANGVRLGSIIYGFNPTIRVSNKGIMNTLKNIRNKYVQNKYNLSKVSTNVDLDIKPCISMFTNILQIKDVKKGENIGYGFSYKAKENIKIAIIPVGYNNGIGFGINSHYVLINDKKCYTVGQTSMNMMAIKIDNNVNINDKVVIMNEILTPQIVAKFTKKLTIEILLMTGHANIKRYTLNNKVVKEINL